MAAGFSVGRPAFLSQSARAEQGVDRGLAADVTELFRILSVWQRFAIGDGVGLVDQDAQPLGRLFAGLIQDLAASGEVLGDLSDEGDGLPMQPRHRLVETRPDFLRGPAIGGDREFLSRKPDSVKCSS